MSGVSKKCWWKAYNDASTNKLGGFGGVFKNVGVYGYRNKNHATLTGRTEGFKLVDFAGNRDLIGQMVDVEITEGKTFSLSGKIVEK